MPPVSALICWGLSNHFHLILRSRPDVVATWDDGQVARRWLRLCPVRKTKDGLPADPSDPEIDSLCNEPDKLKAIRSRLSDIGWWMRLLCQQIATRANRDDQETGKFWQSRYRAVRLLDEQALLACAAYVDLNPIRAAMAQTLETSDHTSVQRRIQSLKPDRKAGAAAEQTTPSQSAKSGRSAKESTELAALADGFLAPVALQERTGKPGLCPNRTGLRCSDKGFLPISIEDYLVLLDWTARQPAQGKRGRTPKALQPIFERLALDRNVWCNLVRSFGRLFGNVAGLPVTIEATTSRVTHRRYNLRTAAREVFSARRSPA